MVLRARTLVEELRATLGGFTPEEWQMGFYAPELRLSLVDGERWGSQVTCCLRGGGCPCSRRKIPRTVRGCAQVARFLGLADVEVV